MAVEPNRDEGIKCYKFLVIVQSESLQPLNVANYRGHLCHLESIGKRGSLGVFKFDRYADFQTKIENSKNKSIINICR
jgi:hypothetical protein